MKLPIKTRILEKDGPFTSKELSEVLKVEYNNEKTTTIKEIEKQLDMYCRVGFLDDEKVDLEGDQLIVTYRITETGKNSLKYIPGHGNKWF